MFLFIQYSNNYFHYLQKHQVFGLPNPHSLSKVTIYLCIDIGIITNYLTSSPPAQAPESLPSLQRT